MAPRKKAEAKKAPAAKPGAKPVGLGHNGLTDEQRDGLLVIHREAYEAKLDAKKKADANFKNVCKVARAELGDRAIDDIKDDIQLDTPEGEARLMAEIERMTRIARARGVPIGKQMDMFADPAPEFTPAFCEGKRDGMHGRPMKTVHAPGTAGYEEYCRGYQDGQTIIMDVRAHRDIAQGATILTTEPPPANGAGDEGEAEGGEPTDGAEQQPKAGGEDDPRPRFLKDGEKPPEQQKPGRQPRRQSNYVDEFKQANGIGDTPPTHRISN